MNKDKEKRIDKILLEDADFLEKLGKEEKVGSKSNEDRDLDETLRENADLLEKLGKEEKV